MRIVWRDGVTDVRIGDQFRQCNLLWEVVGFSKMKRIGQWSTHLVPDIQCQLLDKPPVWIIPYLDESARVWWSAEQVAEALSNTT